LRFDVFLTLWGEAYVNKYLEFSLASQLSPGNIPAAAEDAELVFHIFTDRDSEAYFHPGIDPLRALAEVRFRYFEDTPYRGGSLAEAMNNSDPSILKHNVQRLTSRILIEEAMAGGASGVILLDSDFIFSDGSWPAMMARFKDGAAAVCAMFMRLEEEGAAGRLRGALTGGIDARQLVDIGLEAMHPVAARMFLDAEPFTGYPSQINWRVGSHGFLTHCFFPHPLLVAPQTGGNYSGTMDYEFALRAVPGDAAVHLIRSSDELLVCKMSARAYLADLPPGPAPTVGSLAGFALNNSNQRHRLFMAQPIRFQAGGDETEWLAAEEGAAKLIEAIYKTVELMVANAGSENAETLVRLKSYLGPIEDFMSPQTRARLKGWLPG
jgi:hypothetical protein